MSYLYMKITDSFFSLFGGTNKAKPNKVNDQEGVVESYSELTLEKSDEDLLQLASRWEHVYGNSDVKKRIHEEGGTNEKYWRGRQYPDTEYDNSKRPLTDNIIFEAVETMIPLATQQNPDPIVLCKDTEQAKSIYKALTYLSNYNFLKTKLKKGVRHWTMRFVGCWQLGYDGIDNEIVVKALHPKKLIMDPNSCIEEGEYQGEFLGVLQNDIASTLVLKFPNKEKEIRDLVDGKMGSKVNYTQWWTNEYIFYKVNDIILGKYKNPHWNYDKETFKMDEFGEQIQEMIPGKNHFASPKMPFVFLTTFDLGEDPADDTSLISQSIVNQDNINKRLKQIDKNADGINGGCVVSEQAFNKEQAAQVAQARREGRTVVVPEGMAIGDAIMFPDVPQLPSSLFATLNDGRDRLFSRFGAAGSTAQEGKESTVRGKIIEGNQDSSRIGGGVSEYLEIAAARIFNHMLQMIYVYYDSPHLIANIGEANATEMITLSRDEITEDKILITVQNGSMIPQDELSAYNESMALWEKKAIDPLSLYEKLKDPNPKERAMKLMIFQNDPQRYMAEYLGIQPTIMPGMEMGAVGNETGQPLPQPEKQQESDIIKSVPMNPI